MKQTALQAFRVLSPSGPVAVSVPAALRFKRLVGALGLAVLVCTLPALAADADIHVRQTWKLLDYLAVDYGGAVANGAVISESEYAEMQEFAATARAQLNDLPPREEQQSLRNQADQLQAAIAGKKEAAEVARIAHDLADGLLAAYPVPLAPAKIPDPARGAMLFREKCGVCHGMEGRGDGPAAAKLDPPPIAFTDHARARERSLFALYEVISQGLADTPMVSFQAAFSDDERWALAFHVASFADTPELRRAGEALWRDTPSLRARLPNLESLSRATEESLAKDLGAEKARAILAYLRSHPAAIEQGTAGGLALARAQLDESVRAYRNGDAKRAASLALSAYLDGFEPIEAVLRARDNTLLGRVETAMGEYRSRIGGQLPADNVADQAQVVLGLFDATDKVLASSADDTTATFLGAFTILVREGIEALLVVVAMIGFLGKVERRDVLPYVHAGWAVALVAGVATWGVAAYVTDISGANRELTEGFSSLFAAVVLLGVGIWMHQKSLAGRWQVYLKEKLSAALTQRSAFFLFTLAFVAVYREVFETILFYAALWTRGNGGAILAGLAAGTVVLALIAALLLRTSRRLPIAQFFAASSLLIAVLAVVLAGKGIAALQEAGWLPAIAVSFPRIEILGVYPYILPLLAQLAVIVFAVAGYLVNTRAPAKAAQSKGPGV